MTAKYHFVASAVPYAWFIHDSDDQRVPGSVFQTIGRDAFAYECALWNGTRMVFDHLRAETLERLGEKVAAYLTADAAESA